MKVQLVSCLILLLLFGVSVVGIATSDYNPKENYKEEVIEDQEIKLYQGPVPEGYDQEYFRKTGITKPLE